MLLRVSLLLALSPLWFTWGEVPLKVCCVENPTYTEEYRCISNGDAAVTNYTWYKQDQKGLPEGVMAEGDTLHFLKWTYDISGTYICVAINQKGVNSASFYTYIQKREECFCSWILKKAYPQMVYVIPVENPTHAEEYHCISEANPETSKYSWYRQGWNALPDGVKAEGNRLLFMKSIPELNGLYICQVVNQLGTTVGSLYRQRHTEL